MARFFSALVRAATGRLLWLNIALLVAIKVAIPLGGLGLASITGVFALPNPDLVVVQTNAARTAAGAPALARSTVLDRAAEQKLDDMAARGYFAHVSPDGRQAWDFMLGAGYRYRAAGENLGRGFSDPAQLVAAWMGSPSHRANIVSTAYRDIGVAVRRVTLDGKPATVVVQLFASPQFAAAPVPVRSIAPKPKPVAAAPAPERVSTEQSIAAVPAPVTVAGAATPRFAVSLSGAFMTYLSLLMGLMVAAAGWVGWHRRAVLGLAAHAGLIAVLMFVPRLVPVLRGVIF